MYAEGRLLMGHGPGAAGGGRSWAEMRARRLTLQVLTFWRLWLRVVNIAVGRSRGVPYDIAETRSGGSLWGNSKVQCVRSAAKISR